MTNPEIYTRNDLQYDENSKPFITVRIAGKDIDLPMQFVQISELEQLLLAWVDANRPEITNNGALALAELLTNINPSLVITPFSSKSIPMAEKAVTIFNKQSNTNIELLTLFGGKDLELVESQINSKGYIHPYNPVTSSQKKKYVGITNAQAEIIKVHLKSGNKIAIVDDVYGTGATVEAVRDSIRAATETTIQNEQLPVLVVAREVENPSEIDKSDPIFPYILLPIIRNQQS